MLRAGIVGLPNVGKSTLFNALTQTHKAPSENYPFCTIEPNVGVVTVPDKRLEVLSKISQSQKIIPTVIEIVDIAGLVKGASTGEGLGNKFLSNIREVDAVIQVVRCFEDENIHHVHGNINPENDIEVITTELVLSDLASMEKRHHKNIKSIRSGDAKAKEENDLLDRLIPHLNEAKPALTLSCNDDEKALLKNFFLLTEKPTIFACNVAEGDLAKADENPYVKKVMDYVKQSHNATSIIISAQIESDLVELSLQEQKEYLADINVAESGVGQLIRETYDLLGLSTYLTTGEKETRAWTIHKGDKAPQAAGVIHTDFERGFIAVECVSFEDLVSCGSFSKAKEMAKLRTEGKGYTVKDGDVMDFRFNV